MTVLKLLKNTPIKRVQECLARAHRAVDEVFGWKVLLSEIISRLQVQSLQLVRITRNINPCSGSWLTELEQSIPGVQIKGLVRDFLVDSRVQHETPEESRRIYWAKRCEYNKRDEINSPNISSDKNIKVHLRNLDKECKNSLKSSFKKNSL